MYVHVFREGQQIFEKAFFHMTTKAVEWIEISKENFEATN